MSYAQEFVNGLKEEKAKEILAALILALDETDSDDMLGTEGWRHYLGFSRSIPCDND